MKVSLKLYGNMRRYLPPGADRLELSVDAGSNIEEVLRTLGISDSEVWAVSVNGEVVDRHYMLGPHDSVEVFAPVAGGWRTK